MPKKVAFLVDQAFSHRFVQPFGRLEKVCGRGFWFASAAHRDYRVKERQQFESGEGWNDNCVWTAGGNRPGHHVVLLAGERANQSTLPKGKLAHECTPHQLHERFPIAGEGEFCFEPVQQDVFGQSRARASISAQSCGL